MLTFMRAEAGISWRSWNQTFKHQTIFRRKPIKTQLSFFLQYGQVLFNCNAFYCPGAAIACRIFHRHQFAGTNPGYTPGTNKCACNRYGCIEPANKFGAGVDDVYTAGATEKSPSLGHYPNWFRCGYAGPADNWFAKKKKKQVAGGRGHRCLEDAGTAVNQFTTLFAQLLLANASGFALNAKPIPRIYPIASRNASLLLKLGLVLMSACTSISTL